MEREEGLHGNLKELPELAAQEDICRVEKSRDRIKSKTVLYHKCHEK